VSILPRESTAGYKDHVTSTMCKESRARL